MSAPRKSLWSLIPVNVLEGWGKTHTHNIWSVLLGTLTDQQVTRYAPEVDRIFVYHLLVCFWDPYTSCTHSARAVVALVQESAVLA